MFFLIRMVFWFSLVLLLLPLGTAGTGNTVGPIQALMAAREAVGDLAGICERKPDVCETGKSAIQTITTRAGEAARIASDLLDDDKPAPDTTTLTGSVPMETEAVERPTTSDRLAGDRVAGDKIAGTATVLPAEVNIPAAR
jgi:hypothetical protein